MRILHVAPTFYPARYWGGPTVSLHALCNHLAALPGVELRVLTTDSAGPGRNERLSHAEIAAAQFPGYEVSFARKTAGRDFSLQLLMRLRPAIVWADVVHLTAVYSSTALPVLALARMLGKPLVWSPRGALQRWSGSRKRLLKNAWEGACRALAPRDMVLHVTSDAEAVESSARLGGIEAAVIPNGVEMPASEVGRGPRPAGSLRLAYLGRLDPKKGIENLLEALALPATSRHSLNIYGEGSPGYRASLERKIRELGLEARAQLKGVVDGNAKSVALFDADLLVVPSHTENFAMVVAEALAHGTPVIASTGTPWQEIETRGVGRWIPNDPSSIAQAIQSLESRDLEEMGRRGRAWMASEFAWSGVAQRMAQLYGALHARSLARRGQPHGAPP